MTLTDVLPKTASEVTAVLVGVGNLALTAYLWLVRANKERPRLQTRLVAVEQVREGREFESGWDPVVALRVAVVNLSTLPNVVLGVRAWSRRADGSWAAADARFADGSAALNVGPQVAEFRTVTFELERTPWPRLPAEELEALPWRQVLEQAVGGQMVVKIELISLGEKTFTDEIRVPAAG